MWSFGPFPITGRPQWRDLQFAPCAAPIPPSLSAGTAWREEMAFATGRDRRTARDSGQGPPNREGPHGGGLLAGLVGLLARQAKPQTPARAKPRSAAATSGTGCTPARAARGRAGGRQAIAATARLVGLEPPSAPPPAPPSEACHWAPDDAACPASTRRRRQAPP